jgi:hypothetical protein
MYQVTVKGRTLEELKHAVNDINEELHSGTKPVNGLIKTIEETIGGTLSEAPTMELAEDEEEVASPYSDPATHAAAHVAEVAAVASGTELDAEGIPWDKRIHASSKGKVAKGTWRTKRGLDVAVLAQVKAELLQNIHLAANPVAIPAAPITPATPAVAAPFAVPAAAPVVEAPPAVVAPMAPPVAAPVINGGHTLESFKTNMAMVIGTLITEGKLTQDYVNTLMTHFGVTEIWNVTDAQKEEMFNTFVAHSIIVQVG